VNTYQERTAETRTHLTPIQFTNDCTDEFADDFTDRYLTDNTTNKHFRYLHYTLNTTEEIPWY
jgi:hypothetical protein